MEAVCERDPEMSVHIRDTSDTHAARPFENRDTRYLETFRVFPASTKAKITGIRPGEG